MQKGAILVVEDEPVIRDLIEAVLSDAGYCVAGAGNGDEAMLLLDAPAPCLVGMICDIRLGGGISGWAVARRARAIMPAVGAVYISGDSQIDWKAHAVPGGRFLVKPFNGRDVVAMIGAVASARLN